MQRVIQSPQQLALLLKSTRQAQGLTQASLASRLGFSQNRLSELENDASSLPLDRLLALSQALGLELLVRKAGPASDTLAGDASRSPAPEW
jgi:HTH-type transcriptional regulator/antitoxin HipB